MTIHGPHVGEAELLKNRAHFGHRQAAHAAFETVELCGEIATHERQVTHALLHAAGEELHRRAEPHPIQMTGESPDWRGNGHVVVIEHHQKGGVRHVTGVIDRLQGHTAGEGSITDHRHAFVILTKPVPGHGHSQSS